MGLLLGNLMTVVYCVLCIVIVLTPFVALLSELPRFLAHDVTLLQNKLTHMHFRQHWSYLKSIQTFYIRLRIWVMPNVLQDHYLVTYSIEQSPP